MHVLQQDVGTMALGKYHSGNAVRRRLRRRRSRRHRLLRAPVNNIIYFAGNGDATFRAATFNDFSVYLNNNDGSFATGVPHATREAGTTFVGGVAGGDLDGDGEDDVVACQSSASMSVMRGHPDASFDTGVPIDLGGGACANPIIGDITGDGAPDVVVTGGAVNTQFIVFVNRGNLAFDRVEIPLGTRAASLALGDIDGDGDGLLDIAVALDQIARVRVFFSSH